MENKDNKITIQCYAREIKTEKNSFIAVTSQINGKFYKIKFKKDCNTIPRKKGLFHLTVDLDKISIQYGKEYAAKDGKKKEENPTIWVEEVDELKYFTDEELKALNRDKVASELMIK